MSAAMLVIALWTLWQAPAPAWIETQVKGHSARVEVSPDGSLLVNHELILKVRGGPMKTVEIAGIGTELEALPDAFVRRAEDGSAGRWPLHLSSMEDGAMRLGIGIDRGLRGGNYVFSFGYRVTSRNLGAVEIEGDRAIVTWIGPRLATGVDSARVTFVVPHGDAEPRIAPVADGPGANVLLGELRRGVDTDEVDLVRAHLATGEPAVWRVSVASSIFRSSVTSSNKAGTMSSVLPRMRSSHQWTLPWVQGLWLSSIACVFALLVFCKERAVQRIAHIVDARAVALVPLPGLGRAAVAGMAVAGLGWAVSLQRMPGVLVFLALALVVTTYLLPVRRVRPRGPGQWHLISRPPEAGPCLLPGRWFDVSDVRGAGLFLLLSIAVVSVSYRVLPSSNYLALMVLLGLPLLMPLFFTGTRRVFPRPPLEQARPWFRYFDRVLDDQSVSVELWGRAALCSDQAAVPLPDGTTTSWDEVRLRIVLRAAPSGLKALEVIFEERAGVHLSPSILLRVRDESPAFGCLPKDISWQRGRSADERVAILSPPAPTFAQTTRLVRSLVRIFAQAQSKSRIERRSGANGHAMGANPGIGMSM